ncbi:hypothetical protein LCGC14_2973320, partial [marine sediment metagenome]
MKKIILLICFVVLLGMSTSAYALTAVSNCADLQNINNNLSENYFLNNSFDCAGFDFGDGGGFKPIGGNFPAGTNPNNVPASAKFTGTLDGLGNTINNLTINRDMLYVGLFGFTGSTSQIRKLSVDNANINGGAYAGAISGYNYGTISDVRA